jgi:hypothetical protein
VHIADMLGTPGFVSAQRYVLGDVQRAKTAPAPKYLAIYTIITDDIQATFSGIRERARNFTKTDSVDDAGSGHYTYEAIGSPVTHQGDLRQAQ